MSLYDILACPVCKTGIEPQDEYLRCPQCSRKYPIIRGVPIMFPDWDGTNVEHEGELVLRQGYDPFVSRLIMQSLADNQVVVDCGCGNMPIDDPCLIRMDVKLTPYVDVVGDAHAMPFKPGSVDYFFALAVFEHLRNPFLAASEIYDMLKPGGYVYGDCNFVFPYHGFPHHYFNASIHGMKQVFARFRQLRLAVAPFQMPSFAIQSILSTYLSMFPVANDSEQEFTDLIRKVLEYPLRYYDTKMGQEIAFRLSAGNYFAGIKQPTGVETTIPPIVMKTYYASRALKKRFTDPYDLTVPDNILVWARGDGSREYPEIAAYFADLKPFSKYVDPSRPWDRSVIKGYPLPPDPSHLHACISAEEIARHRNGKDSGAAPNSYSAALAQPRKKNAFRKMTNRVLARLRS
jgi:uncharacterized protein YbaR (Trm112 family)/SAM-dependent methyltransferase